MLNIAILLADVTKPEMSNILTLTWPVTSLVTPRSIKFVFSRQFFPGLSNAAWIFRIGLVVSEIRGGGLEIAPPQWGALFRRRLSAEGAKPESNNRWKSELGHVCMYVCGYVWYLELSREPRHVAQQTRYQNVGLRNGHCLGTVSSGCDF